MRPWLKYKSQWMVRINSYKQIRGLPPLWGTATIHFGELLQPATVSPDFWIELAIVSPDFWIKLTIVCLDFWIKVVSLH